MDKQKVEKVVSASVNEAISEFNKICKTYDDALELYTSSDEKTYGSLFKTYMATKQVIVNLNMEVHTVLLLNKPARIAMLLEHTDTIKNVIKIFNKYEPMVRNYYGLTQLV